MDEWKAIDLSQFENVALYGSNPMDASSREDYFDSLFYSRAVVGLNTSAFLEAAIVDRPVHTILTPEFADNQTGTLHFHYLLNVGGGVLHTSTTFEEHHAELGASLRRSPTTPGSNPRFVQDFIRPRGLRTPATLVFCDAVDDLLKLPVPRPERTPLHLLLVRWAAYPVFLILRALTAPTSSATTGAARIPSTSASFRSARKRGRRATRPPRRRSASASGVAWRRRRRATRRCARRPTVAPSGRVPPRERADPRRGRA